MSCKMYTILFYISAITSITASRSFRFDYSYYQNIDGWLKMHPIPATWYDAFKRCDSEGAVLASPISSSMISSMLIHKKVDNTTDCPIFTGVHATFSKGNFFSIKGELLEKMPVKWTQGEPDNANNNEDCIVFLEDGTIADVNCTEMFPYMCYKENNRHMIVTACGTVDKDYEMNPQNGNCYKFHRVGRSFNDAFMVCSSEGGYLAIINNENENQYLWNLHNKHNHSVIDNADKKHLRIGIYNWGPNPNSDWRTIHGERLEDIGYVNWDKNYPHSKSSNCVLYDSISKKWSTGNCSSPIAFICEKIPDSIYEDKK